MGRACFYVRMIHLRNAYNLILNKDYTFYLKHFSMRRKAIFNNMPACRFVSAKLIGLEALFYKNRTSFNKNMV